MFAERFRSHHDAEASIGRALGIEVNSRKGVVSWEEVESALSKSPGKGRKCIYVHIPFCDKICNFCNLNRSERSGANLDIYADFIISEIRKLSSYRYIRESEFQAVYFGGGTPTILNEFQISRILCEMKMNFSLSQDCEITFESTLHNLSSTKATILEGAGVNRLSIGIQTFSPRGRKLLGRTYDSASAIERLHHLRDSFGGVLGVDIIYSYPEQTMEEVAFDAEMAARAKVDSASFYSLMIHEGSTLGNDVQSGALVFDRTIESDRLRHNIFYDSMVSSGYKLLELSKMAFLDKDEYRYIRIRYDNGDVLPIGSGAGGGLAGYRIYSVAPGRTMASAVNPHYEKYHRMFGLLQFGMYDINTIAEGLQMPDVNILAEKMNHFESIGLLIKISDGRYELTSDGVFWGTNVAVELLEAAITANFTKEGAYAQH